DRAALAPDLEIADPAIVSDVEVQDDLVSAQRVEPLDAVGRVDRQPAAGPPAAVVVEDDLPVEVFEVGHGGSRSLQISVADLGSGSQRAKKSAALSRPSANASMSDSVLYR